MKPIYIYLSLLLSLPTISSAQQIYVGLLGGISRSNAFGTENARNFQDISQAWGGVYGEFMFGKHFGVYTAINYQRKGWKEDAFNTNIENLKYRQVFGYLTQPVMAQYSWGEKLRGAIRLGTYLGYHFRQEIARVEGLRAWPGTNDRLFVPNPEYTPVLPDRVDWGAAAGVGLNLALSEKLSLGLQSNFQVSLKDMGQEIDWRGPLVPLRHIYGDLGISLGYRIAGRE